LAGVNLCRADDLEKICYDSLDRKWTYEIGGCFSKPCIVYAGETMYMLKINSTTSTITVENYSYYDFLGRTGEKTFEMSDTWVLDQKFKDATKRTLKMYFVEDDIYPIKIGQVCLHGDRDDPSTRPNLKLLKLTGNQLSYQVILPECFKKITKKKCKGLLTP